jgi:acyl-CoA synthetase (AMP-forming)/AMP-acid ligase II
MQSFVDRGDIRRHDVPEHVEIVVAIEKASVGKLNKSLIRDRMRPKEGRSLSKLYLPRGGDGNTTG